MIKILIVDDDPFVRDMTELILQSAGYEAETAGSGPEALGKFGKGSGFQVVISDMNMPEMDGLALIRELRKISPETAAILMTGDEDAGLAASGADACVVKDGDLQDKIASVVEAVIMKKGFQGPIR